MSDWESVKTRLEEKRRRGEEFHAESIDVQVSDIRAALERVEELERLREGESREGCRSANCEKVGGSADHPHPAHPSLGALYDMGHTLPDQQCSAIEHKALRAEVERLRAALEQAPGIAGGHTGPGNTLETCHGYSNACREISATLRDHVRAALAPEVK